MIYFISDPDGYWLEILPKGKIVLKALMLYIKAFKSKVSGNI